MKNAMSLVLNRGERKKILKKIVNIKWNTMQSF